MVLVQRNLDMPPPCTTFYRSKDYKCNACVLLLQLPPLLLFVLLPTPSKGLVRRSQCLHPSQIHGARTDGFEGLDMRAQARLPPL
ncbi:hypothetical protein EJ03DRAFT_326815 [Teratosphaeria nubilosa]|uniref:Uncharacterized protein n=1 Tax=Teratosphaeria nubilosa TaxID=161662 RepID=A0A6G1LC53_9PEZI|nr:hypothetical protein EJ03DRAFT_326815 [Teratosphaeria nubilosa]